MTFYIKYIEIFYKYYIIIMISNKKGRLKMPIEIPYEMFKPWKIAYNNCKKQASFKIKDIYDLEFLDRLKNTYKSTFKDQKQHKGVIKFDTVRNFFTQVIEYANQYLDNRKKWSKFYAKNREKAVRQLLEESKKVLASLDAQMNAAKNEYNEYNQKNWFGKAGAKLTGNEASPVDGSSPVKIEQQHPPCITSIVLDIPYMKVNITSMRCYIIIRGSGAMSYLNNSTFNFRNYELNGNKSYNDKDFKSRSLFKVTSIPIKLPIGLGSVKLDIFISPNDWGSKLALKKISIGEVYINKELLSSSEL